MNPTTPVWIYADSHIRLRVADAIASGKLSKSLENIFATFLVTGAPIAKPRGALYPVPSPFGALWWELYWHTTPGDK